MELGGDVEQMIVRFEARHEETRKSKTSWGFRPEKWIEDRHGERKAKLLIEKKENLGLQLNQTSLDLLFGVHDNTPLKSNPGRYQILNYPIPMRSSTSAWWSSTSATSVRLSG